MATDCYSVVNISVQHCFVICRMDNVVRFRNMKGFEMIARDLTTMELMEAWHEERAASRWKVQFPLLGERGTESLGTVYFEIEPGDELASHMDSHDEIVVVLAGSGEGYVGDESATVSSGGVVFIPAMAPHGFRNTGSETLKALGVFAGANLVSEFKYEIKPLGLRVVDFEQLQTPA